MLTAFSLYHSPLLVEEDRVRTIANYETPQVAQRAFAVRVMLLTRDTDGHSARRLAGFGSRVDCEAELYAALSGIIDDPLGYDLFVMDCDDFGGIEAGERAVATLIAAEARMRIMLISRDFDVPTYPMGRRTVVCLPSPVSDHCFRFGLDHAMRDRKVMQLS